MKIEQQNQYVSRLKLSNDLIQIIEKLTKNKIPNDGYITLNFRDPSYSAEQGGYHPVEISINAAGQVQYITDFSYVGQGSYAELAKEQDFDFSLSLFQHMGRDYPIEQGIELFRIFQSNFCSYYQSGVFEVEIS